MTDLVESAIDVQTSPGDLVIFSNMLIHGAHPNRLVV
jgi:ectoine hydroxylase-related dioxygenase (phytanoyl-CoA dioxygenase family)